MINFNHFEYVSTIDYPLKSSSVVFLNECPLKCIHCFNKSTWKALNIVNIDSVKEKILSSIPFIDAVVFSGGEPTKQINELIELCYFSRINKLLVGVETCGFYPDNLMKLKPFINKIFLDIKAPIDKPDEYYNITQNYKVLGNVLKTLSLDLPIEIRIVDMNNSKEIIDSLSGTKFKITILPFIKHDEHI